LLFARDVEAHGFIDGWQYFDRELNAGAGFL